jgi:hypothetical protein
VLRAATTSQTQLRPYSCRQRGQNHIPGCCLLCLYTCSLECGDGWHTLRRLVFANARKFTIIHNVVQPKASTISPPARRLSAKRKPKRLRYLTYLMRSWAHVTGAVGAPPIYILIYTALRDVEIRSLPLLRLGGMEPLLHSLALCLECRITTCIVTSSS